MRCCSSMLVLLWVGSASGQLVPEVARYEGPSVSDPIEIRYAWRSVVNADEDRVAISYGHWGGAGEVRIYDLESGATLHRYPSDRGARAICKLPDGKRFATGDFSGNIIVRNFADGAEVARWKTPNGSAEMLCFSADGKTCFVSSNGDYVAALEVPSGQLLKTYKGHTDNVYDVAVSPDETRLVSSSNIGVILVHDVESGEVLHQLSHPGQVASVQWKQDSKRFYSVSSDAQVCLWDADSGELLKAAHAGESLFSLDIDEESGLVATGGRRGIHLWTADTLERVNPENPVPNAFEGHRSLVFGASFLSNHRLLTSGWDKQAFLWDRESGAMLQLYDASSAKAGVVALAGNRRLTRAVVARNDGQLALVRVGDLNELSTFRLPEGVSPTALHLDEQLRLYAASAAGTIFVKDLAAVEGAPESESRLVASLEEAVSAIRWVAASGADPGALAAITAGGDLYRVDPRSGETTQTLALGVQPQSIAFAGSTGKFLVLDDEGEVTRFKLEPSDNGRWNLARDGAFSFPANATARLLSVSKDRFVVDLDGLLGQVLQVDSFQFAGRLPGQTEPRTAIVASEDGAALLVGGATGGLSLFHQSLPMLTPVTVAKIAKRDIRYLRFSDDSKQLRAGTIEADFSTLSVPELEVLEKPRRLPPFGIAKAAMSPSRTIKAVGNWSGTVLAATAMSDEILWQVPTDEVKKTGPADAIAITEDHTRVVVGSRDGFVRMYETNPTKLIWTSQPFGVPVNEVAISRDEKYIALSTGDYRRYTEPGLTVLLNMKDGTTEHSWDDGRQKVTGVTFTPDGTKVLACGNDSFRTYDVKSKAKLHEGTSFGGAHWIRFVDDVRCVVTAYPGRVFLWDTELNRVVRRFSEHTQPEGVDAKPMIMGLDVSKDRKLLVTGDSLGQVFLWQLP